MCSSACSEKVTLRVYLESVDAKYGAANYGFKLSCPFKTFWNNQWGLFGIKKKKSKFLVFKFVLDFAMGPLQICI